MTFKIRIIDINEEWCALVVDEQGSINFPHFTASNGWDVVSSTYPSVTTGTVWLRGMNDRLDSKPALFKAKYRDDVVLALKEFAAHCQAGPSDPHVVDVEVIECR